MSVLAVHPWLSMGTKHRAARRSFHPRRHQSRSDFPCKSTCNFKNSKLGGKLESSLDRPAGTLDEATIALAARAASDQAQLAPLPLDRVSRAAGTEGITCLALEWESWQSSYPFRCRHGHQFMCSASFVIQHRISCPECRNNERLAQLKQVAETRGGRCLETNWQGGEVRHRFQCARATPGSVIQGHWCAVCAHLNKISNPHAKARGKYRPVS